MKLAATPRATSRRRDIPQRVTLTYQALPRPECNAFLVLLTIGTVAATVATAEAAAKVVLGCENHQPIAVEIKVSGANRVGSA
jgi:hypothetical protein